MLSIERFPSNLLVDLSMRRSKSTILWEGVVHAVPLFLSEIAPAQLRGGLNIVFQLMVTIGILIANLVNYFTATVHPNGWRFALGGAAIPAVILVFGSLIICETPTSLIERKC